MRLPSLIHRRTNATNRFFAVHEDHLDLGEGQSHVYHHAIAHGDAVLVIPVLTDGRLLVERLYRHPLGRTVLEFPAGGMDPGEDPLAAASRELMEETGHRAADLRRLGALQPLPGLMRLHLEVVLATDVIPAAEPRREPMEIMEILALTREEAWAEAQREEASSFLVLGLAYLGRAQEAS